MLDRVMPLPPLERVEIVEVGTRKPEGDQGFLRLCRKTYRARYVDGTESDIFAYDHVERDALDAVVIAAYALDDRGVPHVFLRSSLRPPCAWRPESRRPLVEKDSLGVLWELPAGLVEPGEYDERGLVRCAARELEEELGFDVAHEDIEPLGPSTFPSAGVMGERHHYTKVRVDPQKRGRPSEDGSVLEQRAQIAQITLEEGLDACRRGLIEDAKTEIALRRLKEELDVA